MAALICTCSYGATQRFLETFGRLHHFQEVLADRREAYTVLQLATPSAALAIDRSH